MEKVIIDPRILVNIANEINKLTGENKRYKDSELASAIREKLIAKSK